MTEKEMDKLISKMKGVFATKEDIDTFPTAEMVARGFQEAQGDRHAIKRAVSEVNADLSQLTATVDDLRERVAKVPTTPDMERLLEKTYNLATLKAEHDRMKKIIREKLHVDV
jgi:hypothetical protein